MDHHLFQTFHAKVLAGCGQGLHRRPYGDSRESWLGTRFFAQGGTREISLV